MKKPELMFEHKKWNGNGSRVSFVLHPAYTYNGITEPGCIRLKMERQVNNTSNEFEMPICACLYIHDLCKMIEVFRGMDENINYGKGLRIETPSGFKIVKMEHRIDPVPGYELMIVAANEDGTNDSRTILLTPTEALGLSLAIENSLCYVAFGVPGGVL